MTKNFNINTNNNDEWLTPKYITDFFNADLDPCSPIIRPWDTAKKHYTIIDNGLINKWDGFVFCNPPYGKETYKWLNKCALHNNCIALIFARTETKGFFNEVWEKANAIFFFKGRLAFHYIDGSIGNTSNAPSVLISYGNNAKIKLYNFSIFNKGKYINLK